MLQIVRMAFNRGVDETHMSHYERRTEFSDQLLERIGVVPESPPEGPIKTRRVSSPVDKFVQGSRVVALWRLKSLRVWQCNLVPCR